MSEYAQRAVIAAAAKRRRDAMLPELRKLNDAIERFLHRSPGFDGDQELALRLASAFADVERVVDELRGRST